MSRAVVLAGSLFAILSIGCGGSTENSVPENLVAPTAAEEQASEEYTESHQIDPATGQPAGS